MHRHWEELRQAEERDHIVQVCLELPYNFLRLDSDDSAFEIKLQKREYDFFIRTVTVIHSVGS